MYRLQHKDHCKINLKQFLFFYTLLALHLLAEMQSFLESYKHLSSTNIIYSHQSQLVSILYFGQIIYFRALYLCEHICSHAVESICQLIN